MMVSRSTLAKVPTKTRVRPAAAAGHRHQPHARYGERRLAHGDPVLWIGRTCRGPGLKTIDWIALDWGTSNLRAWGIGADDRIVAEASSDRGMGKLDRAGFEPALLELIEG